MEENDVMRFDWTGRIESKESTLGLVGLGVGGESMSQFEGSMVRCLPSPDSKLHYFLRGISLLFCPYLPSNVIRPGKWFYCRDV